MKKKNTAKDLTQSITKQPISEINFYYNGVTVDYDSNRDYCECMAICRCSRIVNTKINEIDVFIITKTIINNYNQKLDETDHYCINRVLTILKIWNPDNWDINVCSGYYGEEIQSVKLKYKIAADIENQLNRIVLDLKTTKEKIEALLILEYGYILEKIKNCNYRTETVPKDEILFQREHYQKLDRNAIKAYEDYTLPVGVVLRANHVYNLIDGYHRLNASKCDYVKVFLAENPS